MVELTELNNHRSKIKGWESMKTIIWGRHRWDFYKISYNKNLDPIRILTPYFTKNNIPISKTKQKEIKNLYKYIEDMTWFPLDRLYIQALYQNTITNEKVDLNLSIKSHREKFLEYSKISPAEFFSWVLYIMDWEGLKTLDDILINFFELLNKFQSFILSDLNHVLLKDLFNNYVTNLEEHNIEPIIKLNEESYYKFVTHPRVVECSPSNALKKLFFLIDNSEFLKGVGPFQTWKPSFEKYLFKLEEIFSGKYSKNHKEALRFRRLKEHEARVYDSDSETSFIENNNFIPENIKAKYAFKGWDVNISKPELITTSEMQKYHAMRRRTSDRIKELATIIKEKYKEKNSFRKDFDKIKEETHKPKPKKNEPEISKENSREVLKDIIDNKKV